MCVTSVRLPVQHMRVYCIAISAHQRALPPEDLQAVRTLCPVSTIIHSFRHQSAAVPRRDSLKLLSCPRHHPQPQLLPSRASKLYSKLL